MDRVIYPLLSYVRWVIIDRPLPLASTLGLKTAEAPPPGILRLAIFRLKHFTLHFNRCFTQPYGREKFWDGGISKFYT